MDDTVEKKANISVEIPDHRDVCDCVDLARLMREESVFNVTKYFDEMAVMEFGLRMLSMQLLERGGYFKVAKMPGGKIIGMTIGQAIPYMFSPAEVYIIDHAIYVLPGYRGTSAAVRLLKDFEAWGKKIGATEISLGVSTGVNPKRIDSFYTKMGYATTGGIYKKLLKEEN